VQPERLPRESYRFARAIAAKNREFRRWSALWTDSGVGWWPSCASTDWGAVNPANGSPADWWTVASNCEISAVQGPACAVPEFSQSTAAKRSGITGWVLETLFREDERIVVPHGRSCGRSRLPRAGRREAVRLGSHGISRQRVTRPSCPVRRYTQPTSDTIKQRFSRVELKVSRIPLHTSQSTCWRAGAFRGPTRRPSTGMTTPRPPPA
jgi:hypothetical protein